MSGGDVIITVERQYQIKSIIYFADIPPKETA